MFTTVMSYFPFTLQQYYGTLWPSSQLKSNLWKFLVSILQTHRSVQMEEKAHHNLTTDRSPKHLQMFSFQVYRCHFMAVNFYISWENSFLPHFCKCTFTFPVTVYIVCNNLNAERPKRSRETTVPSHQGLHRRDQEDVVTPHHPMRGLQHMEVTNKYPAEFLGVPPHLPGFAVEPPCLKHLFFCSLQRYS